MDSLIDSFEFSFDGKLATIFNKEHINCQLASLDAHLLISNDHKNEYSRPDDRYLDIVIEVLPNQMFELKEIITY